MAKNQVLWAISSTKLWVTFYSDLWDVCFSLGSVLKFLPMSKELEAGKEKLQPNRLLNNAVSFYIAKAVESGLFSQKPNPNIALGIIEHFSKDPFLENKGDFLPKSESFKDDKDAVISLAKVAFEAYSNKVDIKDLARGKFDPRLIAYAPQALLIYSYLPLLENLTEISRGNLEYGYGKKLNRLQPHNSLAAGEMMKNASKRISEEVANIALSRSLVDNLAVFELGCGNASFSASVVETFKSRGLKAPYILATDLDPNTQITAKKLFQEKGILNKLNLMKVDMGSAHDMQKAASKLTGKNILVHIGYILHENRILATNTLNALTNIFGNENTIFAFSEYYSQDEVTGEVPLWFQTIHAFTQELFKRDELVNFVNNYGLTSIGELTHNLRKDTGQIMNSTTFWEYKRNYFFVPKTKTSKELKVIF